MHAWCSWGTCSFVKEVDVGQSWFLKWGVASLSILLVLGCFLSTLFGLLLYNLVNAKEKILVDTSQLRCFEASRENIDAVAFEANLPLIDLVAAVFLEVSLNMDDQRNIQDNGNEHQQDRDHP